MCTGCHVRKTWGVPVGEIDTWGLKDFQKLTPLEQSARGLRVKGELGCRSEQGLVCDATGNKSYLSV